MAAKSERQEEKISRLTNRIMMDQENVIDKLQEKTSRFGTIRALSGKRTGCSQL